MPLYSLHLNRLTIFFLFRLASYININVFVHIHYRIICSLVSLVEFVCGLVQLFVY